MLKRRSWDCDHIAAISSMHEHHKDGRFGFPIHLTHISGLFHTAGIFYRYQKLFQEPETFIAPTSTLPDCGSSEEVLEPFCSAYPRLGRAGTWFQKEETPHFQAAWNRESTPKLWSSRTSSKLYWASSRTRSPLGMKIANPHPWCGTSI